MRLGIIEERRLAEVKDAELARLEAKREREAERERRRTERERRKAPTTDDALKAMLAAIRTPGSTETPCNVGNPMKSGNSSS
jgi:hypothetical protein